MRMLPIPAYESKHSVKRRRVHFQFFLVVLLVGMFLCTNAVGAAVSSDPSLSISLSIVEGDAFRPGNSFHTITEIRNREALGRIDVVVFYKILDADGKMILSSSETVAVETKSSFVATFNLPVSIEEGVYFLTANVSNLDGSKSSEVHRSFNVVIVPTGEQNLIQYVVVAAFVFTGVVWFYEHRRISKLRISGKELNKYIDGQKKK